MSTRAILGTAVLVVLVAGKARAADFSLQRAGSAVNEVVTITDHWELKIESVLTSDSRITSPAANAAATPPEGISLTRQVTVREVDAAGRWRKLEVLYTAGADGELAGRSFVLDLASATEAAVDKAPVSATALKRLKADRETLARILALDALLGGPVHEGETLEVPPETRSALVSDDETSRVTAMSLRLESINGDQARFTVKMTVEVRPGTGQGAGGGTHEMVGFLSIDRQGRELDLDLVGASAMRDGISGFEGAQVQTTATARLIGKRTIAPARP